MLKELVQEANEARARAQAGALSPAERAAAEHELARRIEAALIEALSQAHDRAFTEVEVKAALGEAGLVLDATSLYAVLKQLVDERRIRREGLKYRAIHPDVLDRQLEDTTPPPKTPAPGTNRR